MKVLRVFFVGLVFGWLMRWVIDKIFLEEELEHCPMKMISSGSASRALETPGQAGSPVQRQRIPPPCPWRK